MPNELWLSGPVSGVHPLLLPAAHALLQSQEDLCAAAAGLTPSELWARPGGVASIGFHLKHVAGATDRLLTYARGEALTEEQKTAARAEARQPGEETDAAPLVAGLGLAIERALAQIRATSPEALLEPRKVGRAGLPSTVLGLVFHAAEHSQRHAGQAATTRRLVRGESGS